MRISQSRSALATGTIVLCALTAIAQAQIEEDWTQFNDPPSNTVCDIVNGSNAQFVVLFASGNLATVAGVVLTELEVDITNPAWPVTFAGEPFGFLDFREDDDGFLRLFWLTLTETVVGIDSFSSEPFDSHEEPSEFAGTGCDACEIIDSSICDPPPDDDDDFPPVIVCGAGADQGLIAAALMLPIVGRLRRRR